MRSRQARASGSPIQLTLPGVDPDWLCCAGCFSFSLPLRVADLTVSAKKHPVPLRSPFGRSLRRHARPLATLRGPAISLSQSQSGSSNPTPCARDIFRTFCRGRCAAFGVIRRILDPPNIYAVSRACLSFHFISHLLGSRTSLWDRPSACKLPLAILDLPRDPAG